MAKADDSGQGNTKRAAACISLGMHACICECPCMHGCSLGRVLSTGLQAGGERLTHALPRLRHMNAHKRFLQYVGMSALHDQKGRRVRFITDFEGYVARTITVAACTVGQVTSCVTCRGAVMRGVIGGGRAWLIH